MPRFTRHEVRRSRRRSGNGGYWVLTLLLAGVLGWIWWQQRPGVPRPVTRPAAETNRPKPGIALRALTNEIAFSSSPTNLPPAPLARNLATNQLPLARADEPKTGMVIPQTNPPIPILTRTNLPVASTATNLIPEFNLDPRVPRTLLEVQIALAQRGISSGSLDGRLGSQTRAALRAFQERERLPATGDANLATKSALLFSEPVFANYIVTSNDLARLTPVGETWLAKSQQQRLDYESVLELVAERGHAHPALIRSLNQGLDWTRVAAGAAITLPNATYPKPKSKAAFLRIRLGERTLAAFGSRSNLLAHFPCSIARRVDKRPVGELLVEKVAENPNYRFDPEVFPESEEGRRLKRRLMIPPGPNNPVGTAWIGLNRPGYGIHGTPRPEEVGRTESHGCFRLSNWNAEYLLQLVMVGTPVVVEP